MDAKWLYQTLEGVGEWERMKILNRRRDAVEAQLRWGEKTQQELCWGSVYLDMMYINCTAVNVQYQSEVRHIVSYPMMKWPEGLPDFGNPHKLHSQHDDAAYPQYRT